MTVLWVREAVEQRRAMSRVVTAANGAVRPVREFTRQFKVRTDSNLDEGAVILAAPGVPRPFDPYLTNAGIDLTALAQTVEPHQTESPKLWMVDVLYSTETGDSTRSDPNPLNRPIEVTFAFSKQTRAAVKDRNDVAVVNSAGFPFDPPIEYDDSRPILTITRNEGSFDVNVPLQYRDAVNTDNFLGFAAPQVKVGAITQSLQYESGVSFARVTYEFEIKSEGWRHKVLDQGYYYHDLVTDKRVQFTDQFGSLVSTPILLDGSGRPLLPGFSNSAGAATKTSFAVAVPDTVFLVTSSTVFGIDPPDLYVKLDDEIMQVLDLAAGGVGNTLRVNRGQRGTLPAAHIANTVVQQEPVYLEFQLYNELPFAPLAIG
jgi:hypothetical protein